jgi:hypothetical protein
MSANRKCAEQDTFEELILDTDNDIYSYDVMDISLLTYTTSSGLTVCNVDLLYRFTPAGYDKTKYSILLKTLPQSTFSHTSSLKICICDDYRKHTCYYLLLRRCSMRRETQWNITNPHYKFLRALSETKWNMTNSIIHWDLHILVTTKLT